MENEEIKVEQVPEKKENTKITTPVAIIIAGLFIMVGILLTNGGGKISSKEKTLSEQVGVSKTKLSECIAGTDKTALGTKIEDSVTSAMKSVPADQRGTPYSVIVGLDANGAKAEIRGAESVENVQKLIAEVTAGKVTTPYTGELPPVDIDNDHIMGDPATAKVIIIEYSDFECPYCKAFQATLKQVVTESNGNVAWVYRHWPIHQNSFEKLIAAECVAKLKGNDAFWKYSDLLFGLLKTSADPVTEQL